MPNIDISRATQVTLSELTRLLKTIQRQPNIWAYVSTTGIDPENGYVCTYYAITPDGTRYLMVRDDS